MSQNVTNGHKFGVTGAIFKTSVFQTYISYKLMYDHGLRVTNLTCVGIDPPGRTSQSKAATLSIMPPVFPFCIYVIPSLRIDLIKFFGSLASDMKLGCSVSKCDEKLNEGDSRKTLRESHGGLSGKGGQTPPSHQLPARHSVPVVRAFQKGGLPPPHNLWIEGHRYKKGEEEGARGSEREREGARGSERGCADDTDSKSSENPARPPPPPSQHRMCKNMWIQP